MKGYGILAVLVSAVLLSIPPLVLGEYDGEMPSISEAESVFTVRHSDSEECSEITASDMTVYETALQIAADAPVEAIKAQALSCYTLLCYQQQTSGCVESTGASFPSAYTEDYWKTHFGEHYEASMAIYRDAVKSIIGQCITYKDQPIMALSHTMNGGMTENGRVVLGQELPYLQSTASPADAAATDQLQTVNVPTATVKEHVTSLLGTEPTGKVSTWFGESVRTEAGTVEQLTLCGKKVSGDQIRELFSLPSASFDIDVQAEQVIFTVHGKGHFVGLSTTGAIAMAKDGHTYEEILHHYYAGVTIQ